MKTILLIAVVVCAMTACTEHNALGPTPSVTVTRVSEVDYDINIPSPTITATLKFEFPDGVRTSPIDAQQRWNYTAAYGGSPNVYFGPTSPNCEYIRAGIVVAPLAVAGLSTFTAGDWPGIGLEAGITYVWVGRFVYTLVPTPGSYSSDPTGAGCYHP